MNLNVDLVSKFPPEKQWLMPEITSDYKIIKTEEEIELSGPLEEQVLVAD